MLRLGIFTYEFSVLLLAEILFVSRMTPFFKFLYLFIIIITYFLFIHLLV